MAEYYVIEHTSPDGTFRPKVDEVRGPFDNEDAAADDIRRESEEAIDGTPCSDEPYSHSTIVQVTRKVSVHLDVRAVLRTKEDAR